MAQLPPSTDEQPTNGDDRKRVGRILNAARDEAVRNPKLGIEFLRRYEEYVKGMAQDERDPAGPGGPISLVHRSSRLIVLGRVAAVTEQLPRVLPVIEARGGMIEQVEDDPRIGVSLVSVSGLSGEALYAVVSELVRQPLGALPPLSVGFDDVTYEAAITFKPIRPQGSSGEAVRTKLSSRRPEGTGHGKGVTIGVIDGAYEPDTAPPRTDGWFDRVIGPADGRPPINQQDPTLLDPGAGHGTFVTGIIASIAPDATIRQYRATDSWGFGSAWRLKDQILQAVADGCQVINISLGFDDPDLIGSPAISAALHQVPSSVVVVGAAGNGGPNTPMLPASHKAAIAVGGVAESLIPLGWSNRGPWVDCSALANPVVSTYVVDPADPLADPNPFAIWAGTSFAAPKVAGKLAVLVGRGMTPVQAMDALRSLAGQGLPSPDFGYLLDLPDEWPPA